VHRKGADRENIVPFRSAPFAFFVKAKLVRLFPRVTRIKRRCMKKIEIYYSPAIPALSTLSTKWRCTNMYKIKIGKIVIRTAAMI
jgi:hypothetical protein